MGKLINKAVHYVKAHESEIMFAGGVASFTGCIVTSCEATLKIDSVLDECDVILDNAKNAEYDSKNERGKELTKAYAVCVGKIAKLYAKPAFLGMTSIACFTRSNQVLNNKVNTLLGAYVALNEKYDSYREEVAEEFGKDKEEDIYSKVRKTSVSDEILEDGEKYASDDAKLMEQFGYRCGKYSKFFDETSYAFESDAEYNRFFILAQQTYMNNELNRKGYLRLNEVYKALGMEETASGSKAGWVINESDDETAFVDFGMFVPNKANRDFINGYERAILLDFNVMYDDIDAEMCKRGMIKQY